MNNFEITPTYQYLNRKLLKLQLIGLNMEEQMIKISKAEYEGMKETIEILQNPEIIIQILESEKNIKKGYIKELEI